MGAQLPKNPETAPAPWGVGKKGNGNKGNRKKGNGKNGNGKNGNQI